MKPTIYDIANKAGVSKSTVSRVLNNQKNISPETKEKVLSAIKEANYKPSRIARGLTGSGFDAILALPNRTMSTTSGNPFFSEVIQSISFISEENNFDLIIQTAHNTEEELQKISNKINEKLIRGIIFLSATMDVNYLNKLDILGIPIVIIGNIEGEYEHIYSIDTDNYHDSYTIVETLIKMGHQNIGCLHAPLDIHVSENRVKGYRRALFDYYLDIKSEWIIDGGYILEDSLASAEKLLTKEKLPTAIFATDIIKALSIFQVAEKLNLRIPDDISLITFNDKTLSSFFTPKLSGRLIPTQELGTKATEILFDLIKGEKKLPKKIILPTELSVTESILNLKSN